jgi:5-methylcytosine-specific restriction endonuclease McrA
VAQRERSGVPHGITSRVQRAVAERAVGVVGMDRIRRGQRTVVGLVVDCFGPVVQSHQAIERSGAAIRARAIDADRGDEGPVIGRKNDVVPALEGAHHVLVQWLAELKPVPRSAEDLRKRTPSRHPTERDGDLLQTVLDGGGREVSSRVRFEPGSGPRANGSGFSAAWPPCVGQPEYPPQAWCPTANPDKSRPQHPLLIVRSYLICRESRCPQARRGQTSLGLSACRQPTASADATIDRMKRRNIPADRRRLMVDAGHRCAIPTCRATVTLNIEHIIDYAIVQDHQYENMIVLCANCHGRKTKGEIDRKSLRQYKANLAVINSRYSYVERPVLEVFRLPATPARASVH